MLAEAAAAYRPDPKFPGCGGRGAWRDGSTAPAYLPVACEIVPIIMFLLERK